MSCGDEAVAPTTLHAPLIMTPTGPEWVEASTLRDRSEPDDTLWSAGNYALAVAQETGEKCTGFLISSNVMVTASHCTAEFVRDMRFDLGRYWEGDDRLGDPNRPAARRYVQERLYELGWDRALEPEFAEDNGPAWFFQAACGDRERSQIEPGIERDISYLRCKPVMAQTRVGEITAQLGDIWGYLETYPDVVKVDLTDWDVQAFGVRVLSKDERDERARTLHHPTRRVGDNDAVCAADDTGAALPVGSMFGECFSTSLDNVEGWSGGPVFGAKGSPGWNRVIGVIHGRRGERPAPLTEWDYAAPYRPGIVESLATRFGPDLADWIGPERPPQWPGWKDSKPPDGDGEGGANPDGTPTNSAGRPSGATWTAACPDRFVATGVMASHDDAVGGLGSFSIVCEPFNRIHPLAATTHALFDAVVRSTGGPGIGQSRILGSSSAGIYNRFRNETHQRDNRERRRLYELLCPPDHLLAGVTFGELADDRMGTVSEIVCADMRERGVATVSRDMYPVMPADADLREREHLQCDPGSVVLAFDFTTIGARPASVALRCAAREF